MRWIKHLTMAHADPAIDAAEDKFGAEAYGVWWHLIEDIAAPMESGKMVPSACHSAVKWASICRTSVRRFTTIVNYFSDLRLIQVQSQDNRITITVSNILKYKDEYSKKSGQTPDPNRERADRDRKQIEKEPLLPSPKNGSGTAHGTRLSISELPDEWKTFAMTDCGWDELRATKTFEVFKDHWKGKAGAAGRKADWLATWRNWCRREVAPTNGSLPFLKKETPLQRLIREDPDYA